MELNQKNIKVKRNKTATTVSYLQNLHKIKKSTKKTKLK